MGLLVLQQPLVVVDLDPALPRPDAAPHQTQQPARLRVQPDHRMQQHAAPDAFTDLAQASPTALAGGEVDLAGVLDRQHVTPDTGR